LSQTGTRKERSEKAGITLQEMNMIEAWQRMRRVKR
jgi:hypothetical protein